MRPVSALVIDTSSWVSYLAGSGADDVDDALAEGRVLLPPIVAAELMSSPLRASERRDLEELLGGLALCATDLDHWIRVGRLRSALRAKGLTVSTLDAHVAQCAIDARADLLTEDRIFERIARHCALRLAAA